MATINVECTIKKAVWYYAFLFLSWFKFKKLLSKIRDKKIIKIIVHAGQKTSIRYVYAHEALK